MDLHILSIKNLHCGSCEDTVKKALGKLSPAPTAVKVSLSADSVAVTAPKELSTNVIVQALAADGFDITSVDNVELDRGEKGTPAWFWRAWKRKRIHKHHCKECQDAAVDHKIKKMLKRNSGTDTLDSEDEPQIAIDDENTEYRATFSIGEMTCASCVNSVTTAVKDQLPEIDQFDVDLVNHSGIAIIRDKRLTAKISSIIRDAGYTCELVELLPVFSSQSYSVEASISGMTCSSCVNSIKENAKRLPFLHDIQINLMSNSGTFVIDDKRRESELKEMIEDCGFDYSLVSMTPIKSFTVKTKARTINLQVEGMFCEHCPEEVTDVLNSYGDAVVIDDPISLDRPYIKFSYIPDSPNVTIRGILEKIKGISGNFKLNIVKPLSVEERSALIAQKEQKKLLYRLILSVIVAIPTFIIGVVAMGLVPSKDHMRMYLEESMWKGAVSRNTWALFFLATPIYFFADDVFHVKTFHEIRSLWRPGVPWTRRFFKFGSMNTLMSLGTSIAYFASIALLIISAQAEPSSTGYTSTYFDSVVFLTMFLLMGRWLDSYSKVKTASAISLLNDLRPDSVTIVEKEDGKYINAADYSLDLLDVGDYIKVLPGQSCSADSILVDGSSSFDESALTGESLPIHKEAGDQIYAGTVNNGTGSVIAKVTAVHGGSLLDSIVSIVRQGQMHRAPVERVAEKVTGVFVPIITLISVSTWVIWLALGYSGSLPQHYLDTDVGGWAVWSLQFSIAVFVVACPCGIGLAAPTALYVGSGLAAKYGILARGGGEAFQEASKLDVIAFDKTGTLTMGGDIKVVDKWLSEEGDFRDLYQLCYDTEAASTHPLGKALTAFVADSMIVDTSPKITKIKEIAGKGLKGLIEWKEKPELNNGEVFIGNEALIRDESADISESLREKLENWKNQGFSVIIMGVRQESKVSVRAAFSASDTIRSESKMVVQELTKKGIACWMISGDNAITAKAIAKQVGIDEENVIAGVLPQEKSDMITWLQKTGNSRKGKKSSRAIVAMVGDGVNDAPSLTVADVGIAIGSGSDIALSSAKFVLLNNNLKSIVILQDLSKAVFHRVLFNFFWAGIYNIIGIPIAAGVIYPHNNARLSPTWASLAMALSSVSVIMSSFLLKFHKPPKKYLE